MKLTPRERLLLIAFSSLFIVLIGGALVTAGVRTLSGLRQENALLSLRLDSLQAAVDQRPLWEQRDTWLNEHTTAFRTREEAAAVLLNWINNWAGQANIELLNREIVEAAQSADDQPE